MRSYTQDHFWIEPLDNGRVRIGITTQAAEKMGPSVYVQFQRESFLKRGQLLAVIESTKAATDLEAPLDLEEIEYHDQLHLHPEWVCHDALGMGWLVEAKVSVPAQLNGLLTQAQYETFTHFR